jgi:uncharacterized protein (TIGR00645 family)
MARHDGTVFSGLTKPASTGVVQVGDTLVPVWAGDTAHHSAPSASHTPHTCIGTLMEKLLASVGSLLYSMRFTMLFFYVGLVAIILGILGKFLLETYKLMNTLLFDELQKIDLIIKVLELVDMTMVAQLVWVVALAGVSLFVTTGHFDSKDMKKPDWLDHVNTYNLKLKLAFAIISISGVHALKTYLSGDLTLENIQIVTLVAVIHFTFVLSAIGISFAERLTREQH